MNSKAKRSSILKKQQRAPSTNERVSPVASLPSGLRSNRKIEFHRKKSIKEFLVGEDVDTIWGNSYEVSTDGTPSSGLEDATLINSSCRSSTNEQNKENQSVNQPFPVDNSVRRNSINATNTSWDLSITIADDEKRKICGETSAVFSQSLNTTERLLVEPQAPSDKVRLKLHADNNEVQAMDISPIKPNNNPSPRKLIYTFPKQAMFVEINDVPDGNRAEQKFTDVSVKAHQQEKPKNPPMTSSLTLVGGNSYYASETWNSHAGYRQGAYTCVSSEPANVSSDVDTTIALTNAMTKVLQSRSNESIQKATNMELDESTTTLPTNALARARPSFLPSNQRPVDESQDQLDRTPTNNKHERNDLLSVDRCDVTQSADISSPLEGHMQRNSLSLDNLSILTDTKQAVMVEENTVKPGSTTEKKRETVTMDFGLSSLSLNLRPSSPEMPVVVKPRILRPTLPIGMLETVKDQSENKKTDPQDEYDRFRTVKHTPAMGFSQQHSAIREYQKETDLASKESLVSMDISTRRHTNKSSLASIHSRMTVDMVESPKQSQNGRSTVFHSLDIDIDSQKPRHRGTILYDGEMDLTTHVPAVARSSNNASRRTNYVQEPVQEETAERMKRGTVLGTVPIDESIECPSHSPQTALNNYRKSINPLDRMKEDGTVVPPMNDPGRKTIICNESMILDVYSTPKAKSGSESSISCVVYGRNVDELAIHATKGNNAVDMKFARPTTFELESCNESPHFVPGRQTVMQEQSMVSERTTSASNRRQRFTTYSVHAMEEDEPSIANCERKNDTKPLLQQSRKSIFNSEEMELTLVKESNAKSIHEVFKEIECTTPTDVMDESYVEHHFRVRMEANEHDAGQACMDLYNAEAEEDKEHQSRQQSRIPRLTTHVREDMQGIQREESKPRYTIHEREDMDVTKLDCGTTTKEVSLDDRSKMNPQEDKKKESTIHPTHKARFSLYEPEVMNLTNICEDQRIESQCYYTDQGRDSMPNECRSMNVGEAHSKSVRVGITDMETEQPATITSGSNESVHRNAAMTITHTGCNDLVGEMQHDVTNYNTFLEHHETSHGTQLHGATKLHQTDHLLEKAFNSTRLSGFPSRPSCYQVVAMDETNITGQVSPSNDMQTNSSEKIAASKARFDSPIHMSTVASNGRIPTLRQNTRQSNYYPEDMESTQAGQTKSAPDRKTCIESFSLRKSDLQRIALQSDAIDMEGITVLESEPTESKLQKHVTGTAQKTNSFAGCTVTPAERDMPTETVVTNKEKPLKGLPNNRLSCYDAFAMVEETVPINTFRLKQGQKSSLNRYEAATSKERKSNDCMDETIVPEKIRVERGGSSVEASSIVCHAEHPPIIDQHQPNGRGTLYGTEETMQLTTALSKANKSVQDKRNRQTILQQANMDLTLVGRETVTPPSCAKQEAVYQRKTIYNVEAMEETPPHGNLNAANDTNVQNTVSTIVNRASISEPGHQPVVAERSHRRPRQTILIPQDMDVEEEEAEQVGEGQQSFALSMVPRETTEDRVPRSASILPKRAFLREPSIHGYPDCTKLGPQIERQSSQSIDQKIVTRNDTSAFNTHEISDISLATTTMEPELPCIGNITGTMSMREITEPLPLASFQEQSQSVSVICRVDGQEYGPPFEKEQKNLHDTTVGVQTMAFVPTHQNGASDDEFYDAEGDAAFEPDLLVDPLSLTKSRHLTMKFIDVGHLEQTNYNTTAPAPGVITASKRVHAQVAGSPIINRTTEVEHDPLQMTYARQTLHMDAEHTPRGPIKKRPRTSGASSAPEEISLATTDLTAGVKEPLPSEEVIIKEERQTLINPDRVSQMLIHDPSVFVMEEQNLLDDESDLLCTSLTDELQPANDECTGSKQSSTPPVSTSQPPVSMITELSYYKNFANLTIDTFDSYEEEPLTPLPDDVMNEAEQPEKATEDNFVTDCISVSDEDSLIVTPPKVQLPLAYEGVSGQQTDEILDSTIASKIMYQIRQKHPVVKHPCCGMQTECLCRLRTQLKRHQEMSDLVWNRWCSKYEAIKQRIPKLSHVANPAVQQRNEEDLSVRVTFDEQIEELNWRLLRTKVDDDFLFVKGELSREDVSRRRSRTIISGQYPETPSALFLADNFRSYLSEQLYVDSSPPSGAPMPKIPRITQLIANKLSTDTGTRWLLDYSEDSDGLLQLRHRTLRSFVILIQLQPPRGKAGTVRQITESWRLERIQVREFMEEYVHSPKLLLAHIEFMRLAKETTERTLRSTYRTVADLMGLWHHFHELIQRVFDGLNRLVAIIRNNEALLCYDAQMERFYVKKCLYRTLDDQVDTLLVHFNSIEGIGASGVSFKWPNAELNKLLPASANQNAFFTPGNFKQGVGSNEKTGLMFLECLLWNVAKHYEA